MISWTVLIYALLVAVGGVLGYVRAGSVASLVAGLVSGLLLVGSAVAMMRVSAWLVARPGRHDTAARALWHDGGY